MKPEQEFLNGYPQNQEEIQTDAIEEPASNALAKVHLNGASIQRLKSLRLDDLVRFHRQMELLGGQHWDLYVLDRTRSRLEREYGEAFRKDANPETFLGGLKDAISKLRQKNNKSVSSSIRRLRLCHMKGASLHSDVREFMRRAREIEDNIARMKQEAPFKGELARELLRRVTSKIPDKYGINIKKVVKEGLTCKEIEKMIEDHKALLSASESTTDGETCGSSETSGSDDDTVVTSPKKKKKKDKKSKSKRKDKEDAVIESTNSFDTLTVHEVMVLCHEVSVECIDIGICFQCFDEGHSTSDCHQVLSTRELLRRKRLCYNCEKPGHGYMQCPEPLKPVLARYKRKLEERNLTRGDKKVRTDEAVIVPRESEMKTQVKELDKKFTKMMDEKFNKLLELISSKDGARKDKAICEVEKLSKPLEINMVEYQGTMVPEYGVQGVGSSRGDEIVVHDLRTGLPMLLPGMIDTGASVSVCPMKYAHFCKEVWDVNCFIKCANGTRNHVDKGSCIHLVVNAVDIGEIKVLLIDTPGWESVLISRDVYLKWQHILPLR